MAGVEQVAGLLISAAQAYGPWLVVVLVSVLFLRVVLDEDRSSKWRARFYRAAFAVLGKTSLEKKYISNDIKATLNRARSKSHFGKQILPRVIAIHWIDGSQGETFDVRDGAFVVRLDPSECQEHNIAMLATAVVRRTTLLGIRHVIDPSLELAIDLNLAKRLVEATGNRHIYDWFVANEYQSVVDASEDSRTANRSVVTIDERGLFTRMLLVELDDFSKRIFGLKPRPFMREEVDGLVDFLYKIASRHYGQEVPLQFFGKHIRIGVVLVARTDTILMSVDPYVQALDIDFEAGANSVYVLFLEKVRLGQRDPEAHRVFERQLKGLVDDLDRHAGAPDFDLKFVCTDLDGAPRHARCIRYVVRGSSPSRGERLLRT